MEAAATSPCTRVFTVQCFVTGFTAVFPGCLTCHFGAEVTRKFDGMTLRTQVGSHHQFWAFSGTFLFTLCPTWVTTAQVLGTCTITFVSCGWLATGNCNGVIASWDNLLH